MDLPASVIALGEQLREAGDVEPDPALFCEPEVFAAERERIFTQPLMAVDHETRLTADGHYFRVDAAPRAVIVTRESGGRLHALRNVCIHAGYPVCDAEEGAAERLICPYHGWEFALDGRLVEPVFSSRIDPSRLRLAEYPVEICNGLILVDFSGKSAAGERYGNSLPNWLPGAVVAGRARYSTTWNWKFLHHFLRSSPHLFFDDEPDSHIEFGPLSSMMIRSSQAFLLRLIPRFAGQTDLQVIEMVAGDRSEKDGTLAGSEAVGDRLRRADTSPGWFDRRLADWYWWMMSPA
jgi:nitrite reductase/ring-hydroxylating ferredoxin subunit